MRRIPTIDSEMLGPDGTPAPFDPSLITPYVLRHCYAQRHADAGVPVDVLKELLDHVAIGTTMGYYSISAERDKLAQRLRLQLGAEIEGPDRAQLIARVADLEAVNRQLVAERDARAIEADTATHRTTELEDELCATRLRRVIKDQNRPR